jgi:hypothetical protein
MRTRNLLLCLLAVCGITLLTSSLLLHRTKPTDQAIEKERILDQPKIHVKVPPHGKKHKHSLDDEEEELERILAEVQKKKIPVTKTTTTNAPEKKQPQEKPNADGKYPTIFVSIASFRDAQCAETLHDLIDTAAHLERIYVGIMQQNSIVDPDCVSVSNIDKIGSNTTKLERFIKFRDHIRVIRVAETDAKGPVVARARISAELYQDEDFYLQVDSHSRFVPGWDSKLIYNYNLLPKKSVITHYPADYDAKKNTFPKTWKIDIPILCTGFYNEDKILQPKAGIETNKKQNPKKESMFIAAGMAFYPGIANREVPIDPHSPQLFHGEEISFSVRMAAKGYRFYGPLENTVFHYYYRKKFPKFWDQAEKDPNYERDERRSLQRIKYMMRIIKKDQVEAPETTLKEIEKYSVNWDDPEEKANVEEYFKRYKIDMVKRKVGDLCMVYGKER